MSFPGIILAPPRPPRTMPPLLGYRLNDGGRSTLLLAERGDTEGRTLTVSHRLYWLSSLHRFVGKERWRKNRQEEQRRKQKLQTDGGCRGAVPSKDWLVHLLELNQEKSSAVGITRSDLNQNHSNVREWCRNIDSDFTCFHCKRSITWRHFHSESQVSQEKYE